MNPTMWAAVVVATAGLLGGCAAMEGAAIVQEAKTHLQSIMQSCMQRIESDRELDPIRAKVELVRTGMSGAPPASMLSDQSRPTPVEKAAIAKWQNIREACAQEQIRYGASLSLPPSLEPLRSRLLLVGRETNERTGLLIASLYGGRLTYAQFAAERMKNTDQMMASLTGGASPAAPQQIIANSPSAPTGSDEVRLKKSGGSYLVPVSINGFPPMDFVLDSGAEPVSLPQEVVLTLVRAGTLQRSDLIAPTTIGVASGDEFQSVAFRIRELQVGQHVIRNVTGFVNRTGTSMLLGESFLSRFASWSIDNQRNVLILSR